MKIEKTVTEELDATVELAGAKATVRNGEVTQVLVSWYERTGTASGWKAHRIPNLNQAVCLHKALGELLNELRERGLLPPEEAPGGQDATDDA